MALTKSLISPCGKFLKRFFALAVILTCLCFLQSCSIFQEAQQPQYVSVINDLNRQYIGTTKGYIIENFPYSPTDIKQFDSHYETLIFERYRNALVGYGITKFHLKDGVCYKIETNEYKRQ